MKIAPVDWTILGVSFVFFLALAIYLNSLCRSVADYLISGRKIRLWLGMGAGIAGEIGLVTIVGICEQGYLRGFGFVLIGLLTMVILVPLFGVFGFGIQRFRATKAMSVSQYVEMRYSRRLRVATGMLNSAAGVLQMCIFPIVGAGFLRVLTGAPEHVSVGGWVMPTTWLIMGVLLACAVIFTFLGGYVTLIVSNFFQMIIIMVAMIAVVFFIVEHVGLQAIWTNLEKTKGLDGFYPFAAEGDSYGFIWFAWLLTMSILLQFSYGPYLQKYASMDKPRTASLSYLFGSVFGNGRTFLILFLGVGALAAVGTEAQAGFSEKLWPSMATPWYLSAIIPPVLMGVLLAGLLWADVSTTDQYLLSWSTSIVNDCVCPFLENPLSPRAHIAAVRLTIILLCGLFFLFGTWYQPTIPIWEYLWLCANIIGGTGIIVLFGMYWKRANTTGAVAAVAVSVVLPVADLIARRVWLANGWEYPIKPEVTGLGAYALAVAVLVFFSLLSNKQTRYWDLGKVVREMNKATS
jgi:SSS family solute:Na+ symporter